MMECAIASTASTATGSFQNQTTTSCAISGARRPRAVLLDVSNIEPIRKRACTVKAEKLISMQQKKQAPRGNARAGSTSRWTSSGKPTGDPTVKDQQLPREALQQILQCERKAFDMGHERIGTYVDANVGLETHKAFALLVFSTAITTWGLGILGAAQRVSDVTGVSAYTVRKWASLYYLALIGTPPDDIDNKMVGDLLSSEKGKHCGNAGSILHDEEFRLSAREFVHCHAYKRGEPNMTTKDFSDWIEERFGVSVCIETARVWLHDLGFTQKHHHKTVYFDGHEREDVVAYRKEYVNKMDELDRRCLYPGHTPELLPGEKPLIQIHHDESTFYANADQSSHWGDGALSILKQKSLGQSVKVSDFIEEAGGEYLKHGGEEARLRLETQTEGYFDNEKLLVQVDKAIDIFEAKYPAAQALFLFDNAPSHKKCSDETLNAEKMNVRPGGKQPVMRSTFFNGEVQEMVLPNGQPKGLKIVLEERGVDTRGMNADKLREELNTFEDFKNKVTILQERVEGRGHLCLFFPQFHCELNAIERCWCHAKKYTRAHANGSITRLRPIILEGLNTCTPDIIRKFFVTCRDYVKAYREGHTCRDVDRIVKTYKSHRRVFSVDQ